ncbi:MAG: class II fumarate hydratase [Gammaproteobacteria bacterium]
MNSYRTESDSLGDIQVAAEHYWGAQTQRSIENFDIGRDHFIWPRIFIRALGLVKLACATTNAANGRLPEDIAAPLEQAAREMVAGSLDDHFPLVVFQTGSGTQTNMNANEVLANRAIEILGGELGSKRPVHPNDHVNAGQSSNDVFPTAAHVAAVLAIHEQVLPAASALCEAFACKAAEYPDLVKTGRTHLQDAAPLTLSQEISAWEAQLVFAMRQLQAAARELLPLAIGGTAVGTGLNTYAGFGEQVCARLEDETGHAFRVADNRFAALASHEPLMQCSAALRALASALMKIANDIRWLASGPRCGIGELLIPANEPGSSIMPGKVNPTQAEALTMVCAQVYGNDASVAFACSQGNFQLNVFKPVIIHNILESAALLSDAMHSFDSRCARGLMANEPVIAEHLDNNLMLVTALNPHIGYDKAAEIAKLAEREGLGLREAAIRSGHVSRSQFDEWVDPLTMTHPAEG